MKNRKDWYKHKGYPHIGIPPQSAVSLNRLRAYIQNPISIAKHPFKPFIHITSKTRRFRKEVLPNGDRSKKRTIKIKPREIFYANNTDSNIYAYYSSLLSEKYESLLTQFKIEKVPTAYRTIPTADNKRNKCNIDFAEEIFSYVRKSDKTKLAVIAMDITSFFDNLDHRILKDIWLNLINADRGESLTELPPDHYAVYRNITKFAYVEQNEIFKEFRKEIYVKKKDAICKMPVNDSKFLYNKNAIAYCLENDIKRLRTKGYIKSNKRYSKSGNLRQKGIPQGSSISALLANAYLLNFDIEIQRLVGTKQGLYRRYSDDLVIIVPAKYEKEVILKIHESIKKVKLEIQPQKTQVFWFIKCAGRFYGHEKNRVTNNFQNNTLFQYLGFSFDGKTTLLKSASLASYYRKMKRSVKRGQFYSRSTEAIEKRGELFKNRLYKRFTHLGAKRRRKFERIPGTSNEYTISKKYDWGNFLSYAYMAERVMEHNGIKQQLSKHWKKFHELFG